VTVRTFQLFSIFFKKKIVIWHDSSSSSAACRGDKIQAGVTK
jgi:hypothetical protein